MPNLCRITREKEDIAAYNLRGVRDKLLHVANVLTSDRSTAVTPESPCTGSRDSDPLASPGRRLENCVAPFVIGSMLDVEQSNPRESRHLDERRPLLQRGVRSALVVERNHSLHQVSSDVSRRRVPRTLRRRSIRSES